MTPRIDIEMIRTTSLSMKAREALLELILARHFAGGRLPSEGVLAEKLGVSRTTVRAALQSLQRDGFITRRRGSGTHINRYIVPSRLGLHRLVGFSTLLKEIGRKPSVEISVEMRDELAPAWCERLSLLRETKCYVVEKLFSADGEPAISLTDVVPAVSLRKPLVRRAIPDSIFDLFSDLGTQPIDHAVVEITPRNASAPVARRLGLRPGAAYLALAESHYAAGQPTPVALSFIDVNDRYVRFDVVRRMG
jgi:GntR family transcriptional regulator